MSESADLPTEEIRSIEIVRDSTFCRIVVDELLFSYSGNDMEIGCIQYGPIFLSQSLSAEEETTTNRSVLTEVARIRMSYADFLKSSMMFIQSGLKEGKLNAELICRSTNEWSSEAGNSAPGGDQ